MSSNEKRRGEAMAGVADMYVYRRASAAYRPIDNIIDVMCWHQTEQCAIGR